MVLLSCSAMLEWSFSALMSQKGTPFGPIETHLNPILQHLLYVIMVFLIILCQERRDKAPPSLECTKAQPHNDNALYQYYFNARVNYETMPRWSSSYPRTFLQ